MPNTFTLIASSTVGAGGVSFIEFTSIPQTFTDLYYVASTRDDATATEDQTILQYNGTTSGYTEKILYGNGATAGSANRSGNAGLQDLYSTAATATANTFSSVALYIPNYTSSNNKSESFESVTENNTTTAYAMMGAGLWSNTAAITSIKVSPATAGKKFVQYSSFYLYGVKNA